MVFFHSRDGYWALIGYQAHLSASLSSLSLFSFLFSSASASLSGPPHMLCVTSCRKQKTLPSLEGCHRSILYMCTALMENLQTDLLWTFFWKTARLVMFYPFTLHVLAHSPPISLWFTHPDPLTDADIFLSFLLFHRHSISQCSEFKDPKHFRLTLISPSVCVFIDQQSSFSPHYHQVGLFVDVVLATAWVANSRPTIAEKKKKLCSLWF